jgi:hypothetical protein
MQGASGRNFLWDNSDASLYLTDSGSGASARLKIGSGQDLQLYHDVGGANHITCATNQELKISANKHTFYDYSGVTKRMEINASGQVTQSAQPSFAVYRNQDGHTLNNEVFPFNTARYNIGSHFNTGNHRFTAPVAGRYLFNFYSIYNTGGSSHQIAYRVNNSTSQGMLIHFSHAGGWDYVSYSQMFNLNANDYVTMWSTSNINWHGNSWQLFCGELLS